MAAVASTVTANGSDCKFLEVRGVFVGAVVFVVVVVAIGGL